MIVRMKKKPRFTKGMSMNTTKISLQALKILESLILDFDIPS